MTDTQPYLAIDVPVVLNGAMLLLAVTLLRASIDARLNAIDGACNERFQNLTRNMNQGFESVNRRFDDMRDLWRAELSRVEGVLDARLKHLEEK